MRTSLATRVGATGVVVALLALAGCLPPAPKAAPTCLGRGAAVNLDQPAANILLKTGSRFTICGTGYRAHAAVQIVLHSDPASLGTLVADAEGVVVGTVVEPIPADTPDGIHTVQSSGAAPSGTRTQSAQVTVREDVAAPELVSLSVSPTSIDTSGGPVTITATARITDDLSGHASYPFSGTQIRFQTAGSTQMVDFVLGDPQRISGDKFDGVYHATATVPQFAATGTWGIYWVILPDNVGNQRVLNHSQVAAIVGHPVTFINSN